MVVRASNGFMQYCEILIDGKLAKGQIYYASEEEGFVDGIIDCRFKTVKGKVTIQLKPNTPEEVRQQFQSSLEYQEGMKRIQDRIGLRS